MVSLEVPKTYHELMAVIRGFPAFAIGFALIYSNIGVASVGALSIIVALVCGRVAPNLVGIAGYLYCTIGLVEWRVGEYRGRGRKRLNKANTSPV